MIQERFLVFNEVPRSGRLLEIGCGAGNVSIELAKLGYEVTGTDFSESAIAWAKDNAKLSLVSVGFQTADVTNLSCFEKATFDVVYDGNCIHCLVGDSRGKAFCEIRRVLKPKGIFFVRSLCFTDLDSNFPDEFDCSSNILFDSALPYRQIPTPEVLELELLNAGFETLKKFVRSDRPFGHVNIHAGRVE
jgi:ubiquinone/menaquinone biosynthesis C-methylase UbiE